MLFLDLKSKLQWLTRCRFTKLHGVDQCATALDEQCVAKWMPYDSLDFVLEKQDSTRAIPDYLAFQSIVILANKP
jgi:hypothetical protein